MNSEERDRFAEKLLEAALARYRRAEPLQGIEDRLLARLESAQGRSGVRILLLSWARGPRGRRLPAVEACLALLLALGAAFYLARNHRSVSQSSRVRLRTPMVQTANSGRPGPESRVKERARAEIPSRLTRRATRAKRQHPDGQAQPWNGPRREQFPSPEPLTEQEKLLLSYLRETPAPRAISFHDPEQLMKELQPRPLEALRIEPPKPGGVE
jgi:hypothetical protein